jgi:protocatechuate 3,4-dioxygenase beta subunit
MKRLPSLLVLASTAVLAQTPAPPADIEKPTAVIGTVLNSVTKEPVRGAEIWLNPRPQYHESRKVESPTTATDDGGRYRLNDVKPGVYDVEVQKNGFISLSDSPQRHRREPLVIAPGQTVKIDIELSPHAVITGRVLDEQGEPVSYAQVIVGRALHLGKRQELVYERQANTNDLGEYRVAGLRPGRRYYLAVDHTRPARLSDGRRAVYGRAFFPGVTDLSAAVPLPVNAGEEITANLVLTPRLAFSVRGRIVDKAPKEESHLAITARAEGEFFVMTYASFIAQDGTFELRGLPSGRYTVTGLAQSFQPGQMRPSYRCGTVHVEVGESDLDDVTISIEPAARILGGIRVPDSQERKFRELTIALQPLEGKLSRPLDCAAPYGLPSTQVKEDGSFELPAVPAGVYRVSVHTSRSWQGYYPHSIRFGTRDALIEPITVGEGTQSVLEIALLGDAGRITGVAKDEDGKPYPGATVIGFPQGPLKGRRDAIVRGVSDHLGRFELRGAWPGEYSLLAWDQPEWDLLNNQEWVEGFLPSAPRIRVAPRSVNTLDMQVITLPQEE